MKAHCRGCGAEIDVQFGPFDPVPTDLRCATCAPLAPTAPATPSIDVDVEPISDPGVMVNVTGTFE